MKDEVTDEGGRRSCINSVMFFCVLLVMVMFCVLF